jgi:hypothetical protein
MGHFEDEDARWLRFAAPGAPDECWEWRGFRSPQGYATFTHNGVRMAANRAALMRAGVKVPPDMHACHKCDNPPCVNPSHLYVGTPKDNARDALERGGFARRPRGELHGRAKLTDQQVDEIRQRARAGETYARLAREFPVSNTSIRRIARGEQRINV